MVLDVLWKLCQKLQQGPAVIVIMNNMNNKDDDDSNNLYNNDEITVTIVEIIITRSSIRLVPEMTAFTFHTTLQCKGTIDRDDAAKEEAVGSHRQILCKVWPCVRQVNQYFSHSPVASCCSDTVLSSLEQCCQAAC